MRYYIKGHVLKRIRDNAMIRFVALAVCLVALLAVSDNTFSSENNKKPTTTYQVPTTGDIMDVTYLPEFDEWWVKCREGKAISIYSYDKRSKKWGHASFVPKQPTVKAGKLEESAEKVEPQKKEEATPPQETEVKTPEKGNQSEKPSPSTAEKAPKKDGEAKKKTWWDPLKLLKKPHPAATEPLP
jgi:hypothetical protein